MKRKILVNVVGVILAFLLAALVMIVQGYNPLDTYFRLFEYSLAPGKIAYTLSNVGAFGADRVISISCIRIRRGQPRAAWATADRRIIRDGGRVVSRPATGLDGSHSCSSWR